MPASASPTTTEFHLLLTELRQLRSDVRCDGRATFEGWRPRIRRRAFIPGALNLASYLALRQRDLRSIQERLMPLGLSSLGRSEARVLPTLDAIIATLDRLCASDAPAPHPSRPAYFRGSRLLERNTTELLGATANARRNHIMVTLPSEAAFDADLVHTYVRSGMDCARINCSHDGPEAWIAMVEQVRAAGTAERRPVRILMDLGGPKPRTTGVVVPDPDYRLRAADTVLFYRREPVSRKKHHIQLTCSLPEVIEQLNTGDRVWIDDGKLGARVVEILPEGLLLQVTDTRPKGERLRPEKGMNFPDSSLRLSPLAEQDLADLDVVARYADIVGYSFVQEASDIDLLQQELAARGHQRGRQIGIVAKIETQRAVNNLPEIIARAAARHPFGVMIARGDLAVEIGFARTAEMQEEILWLCEAAHVPVIWATQVLESLVTKGRPSRSEMTDAAMAQRAECVMLNKGPFVVEAVRTLEELFDRMESHQVKKTAQLRQLRSWPL